MSTVRLAARKALICFESAQTSNYHFLLLKMANEVLLELGPIALEAEQDKSDDDDDNGDDDDDDDDEISRISTFMYHHPTMKRLFRVLEKKINPHHNNSNNKTNKGDDDNDDHDEHVDNHCNWLFQNEIDSTVDDFVHQLNTVVTRYEEKVVPIFHDDREQRESFPIPEGIRKCRDDLIDSMNDDYAWDGASEMTASECVCHMELMAQTLLEKTWRKSSNDDEDIVRNRLAKFDRGLDIDFDTEEEVRNMLRIFPGSITGLPFNEWPLNERDYELVIKPQSVSFLPMMLKACADFGENLVSIEEDEEEEYTEDTILHRLVMTDSNIEDKPLYDARCTTVLRQLKNMNMLCSSNVQEYALLNRLCLENTSCKFFARQRFEFLVQLDPYALITQPRSEGEIVGALPLRDCVFCIEDFEIVFEAMVRNFPKMKGICTLFQTGTDPSTGDKQSSPFEAACDFAHICRTECPSRWGSVEVMDVIKRVLERNSYLIPNVNDQTQNCNDAIVLAMLDDSVTLDGLFFLLRRSPDILGKILIPQNNESSSSQNDGIVHRSSSSTATSIIRPSRKRRR